MSDKDRIGSPDIAALERAFSDLLRCSMQSNPMMYVACVERVRGYIGEAINQHYTLAAADPFSLTEYRDAAQGLLNHFRRYSKGHRCEIVTEMESIVAALSTEPQ